MNIDKSVTPLPQILHESAPACARRRSRVGEHRIDPDSLQHFNDLLRRLDIHSPPLECDQVVSAARELAAIASERRWPPCIFQRMRRAAALDRMLVDREWDVRDQPGQAAAEVVTYMHGNAQVIPNKVPVVGRLDDVILVDASWPAVAQEVCDYLDFCRIRRIEAALRGASDCHFGFTREAWQEAARAEARWIEQCHRINGSRYAGTSAAPRFRIH
ncbi:MAG: hypothetical protein M3Q42_03695 [Pseudomonadota bacterium]|nr:hypothetical protein [Pseudomonadota bacterium]